MRNQKEVMPEDPGLYFESLDFWPHQDTLAEVARFVENYTAKNARIIDLMCGPGYLLKWLSNLNPKWELYGIDIDETYVEYASAYGCPDAMVTEGDIMHWKPMNGFDAVICSGSLHHLEPSEQFSALEIMLAGTKPKGLLVLSEVALDDYQLDDEDQRQLAIIRLGDHYVQETLKRGAPDGIVKQTKRIMDNDMAGLEHKQPISWLKDQISRLNGTVLEQVQTWPANSLGGHGEYIWVIRRN